MPKSPRSQTSACRNGKRPCRTRAQPFGALAALASMATMLALPPAAAAKDAHGTSSQRRAAAARVNVQAAPQARHGPAVSVGVASVYGRKFFGRTMANGKPMRPDEHVAASPTLPLGAAALVTNLANGEQAVVTISDRGPFVRGRIIDLSPRTARQLGVNGLARVEVALITPSPIGRAGVEVALADADTDPPAPPR